MAGSLACFAAVFLITVTLTSDSRLSIVVATVAMSVEAASPRDLDNLLIPVFVGLVVHAAAAL